MKKALKIILSIVLCLVLVIAGYVVYVFADYHRLDDHLVLEVDAAENGLADPVDVGADKSYSIATFNVGFGAYDHDFDFFMDGGHQSWGRSKEAVTNNINTSASSLAVIDPDFMMIQELDTNATRSYHINEADLFSETFPAHHKVFAQNYDSPFLFWPLYQPHGSTQAGIMTYSLYPISSSERRSLPISDSVSKLVDLDRCYSINRIPCSDGHDLVLVNLHLSAYGADPSIMESQRAILFEDLVKEYEAGNYVISGGDFNHDMAGDSNTRFDNAISESESWAQPFDFDCIPEHFTLGTQKVLFEQGGQLAPTCRDTGRVFDGTNDTWILDGLIYSDNIEMLDYNTLDLDFVSSDHNPVYMQFRFLPAAETAR